MAEKVWRGLRGDIGSKYILLTGNGLKLANLLIRYDWLSANILSSKNLVLKNYTRFAMKK
jgi:hypothetical protein